MSSPETQVVVAGGGVTGVAVLRSEGASREVVTACKGSPPNNLARSSTAHLGVPTLERPTYWPAGPNELVLATGGVAGHGIEARRDGSLVETVAGLPVTGFPDRAQYLSGRFLGNHPLGAAGVRVDAELRPLGPDGRLLSNLRCVGGLLAGHDPPSRARARASRWQPPPASPSCSRRNRAATARHSRGGP